MRYPTPSRTPAVLITLLAGVGVVVGGNIIRDHVYAKDSTPVTHVPTAITSIPRPNIMLTEADIIGRSAILYDAKTGEVLFEKNADAVFPLASITKLMTALTVLDHADVHAKVVITPDDLIPDGDIGLRVGDQLTFNDLVRLGLIASSNDAMTALANSVSTDTVSLMNARAKTLGMLHSSFNNPTGLDIDESVAGAYGTARDVSLLAEIFYRLHPQYFQLTRYPAVTVAHEGRVLMAPATDTPLLGVPGLMAAKTGYTDLAGGTLVAVVDLDVGHPVIAVVLSSTERGRFTDIKTLVNKARGTL